jgi:toxin ParE1/3/4
MKLIVSRAALADLERLHAFLTDKNKAAADRAAAALIAAMQSLDSFPERGRPSGKDMRELVVPFGGSNYVLRYACARDTDEVIILRVWHGREDRE